MDWLSWSAITNSGTVTVPTWAAAGAAALLVILLLLAVYRAGFAAVAWTLVRVCLLVVAAVAVWGFLGQAAERERAADRRSLEARIQDLAARATAPGSALGCVDIAAGEGLDPLCEKAVFASPETVAAATAYVDAKLSLLGDATAYANREDRTYETPVAALRRTLEVDRFGILAQVLATGDGCTAEHCDRLGLLRDPALVNTHLKDATFTTLVAKYSPAWSTPPKPSTPVAMAPPVEAPTGKVLSGPAFPSSASIPAVSIMTSEPSGPAPPPPAPPPKRAAATPATPAQHPAAHDPTHVHHPAQSPAGPPVQLAPPATEAAAPSQ
jgi:hypothetical protein